MENYFRKLTRLLDFEIEKLEPIIEILFSAIRNKSNIWIIGNGGSASTAEHFETDLSYIKELANLPMIKVAALTSNSAITSAISNDIGFEFVFAHQLKRKAKTDDVLFIISASGNSKNLLNAVDFAKENGIKTIGLLGFDGGKLLKKIDCPFMIESEIGLYGPVEDAHLAICHYISTRVKQQLITEKKD
jgi:D-sedoheptulose 7-phosphate isomerase